MRLEDGAVLRRAPFPADAWGEGIADWRDEIVGLTLDPAPPCAGTATSFAPRGTLPCAGQGWGLARMAGEMVVSDGTPALRFVDPETFAVRRRLTVTEGGRPAALPQRSRLRKGELLANVFMTDTIARIDPATGEVTRASTSPRSSPGPAVAAFATCSTASPMTRPATGCSSPARTGPLFEIRVPRGP